MRLNRFDLTRYGRFTDKVLTFPKPPQGAPDLHIVYGPNEAGKSTLFSGWLDLLFGIHARSRYDFMHRYESMELGAEIDAGERVLDLVRRKRKTASLTTKEGAEIPDAVLQSLLGGLSRDSYSAMFSLDDDTLEKGGESILSSRGELGEMLFAASAGLGGLSAKLDALRGELDGFHKQGKRSGWLYTTRKSLLPELDRQRKELDISAPMLLRLTRDAKAADDAFQQAVQADEAAKSALAERLAQEAARPLAERRDQLRKALAPLADLPEVTAAQQAEAQRLEDALARLATRDIDRQARLDGLQARAAAIATDPYILQLADRIAAAGALHAEYESTINHLPRRIEDVATARADMNLRLGQLGQDGRDPAEVILPPARLAALRRLLDERSGVFARLRAAKDEAETARHKWEEASRDPQLQGDAADDGLLAAFMQRLSADPPQDAVKRQTSRLSEARLAYDTAWGALAPWQGDAAALRGITVPDDKRRMAWQADLDGASMRMKDAAREMAIHQAALSQLRQSLDETVPTLFTLADGATARAKREALWADHLRQMTPASAMAFEQALREEDLLNGQLIDQMATAKQQALRLAEARRLEALITQSQRDHDDAARDHQRICGQIADIGAAIGIGSVDLDGLRNWLSARDRALAVAAELLQAQDGLAQAQGTKDQVALQLAGLLGSKESDFDLLLMQAQIRLQAISARAAARKALDAFARDVQLREARAAQAALEATAWEQAWKDSCDGSVLADYPHDHPEFGTLLDQMDALALSYRQMQQAQERLTKMQANRDRFLEAKALILQDLNADPALSWQALQTRLRQAQDNDQQRAQYTQLIAEEGYDATQDAAETKALSAARSGLAAALGLDDPTCLPERIKECLTASSLRVEIASLEQTLADTPQPDTPADPATLRAQIETLRADQALLAQQREQALAARIEARRALDAVGGDDQLAKIVAERENLLLDTSERARQHLAMRLALTGFDAGLRRYREAHRSTMLRKASDAFAALSGGAYPQLGTQLDGQQEILVAQPRHGGAKFAADLSKGTRFQLYLALRIAGYHELSKSRPSVPFIADDIMETFDDSRAEAAFALLAEMSTTGQVIYLTHHQHLCDIASARCPSVNIISLADPS